jgi:hypothetical protein
MTSASAGFVTVLQIVFLKWNHVLFNCGTKRHFWLQLVSLRKLLVSSVMTLLYLFSLLARLLELSEFTVGVVGICDFLQCIMVIA